MLQFVQCEEFKASAILAYKVEFRSSLWKLKSEDNNQ